EGVAGIAEFTISETVTIHGDVLDPHTVPGKRFGHDLQIGLLANGKLGKERCSDQQGEAGERAAKWTVHFFLLDQLRAWAQLFSADSRSMGTNWARSRGML